MRKSEVLTLPWTAVDLAAGVIRLRDAKTGPRTVVLSQMAIRLLKDIPRLAGNPYVIAGERAGGHEPGWTYVGCPEVWRSW
jgi:integrase